MKIKQSNNILVIGDVHGCLNSLKGIVEESWESDDILVQVGDLIDRGNFSAQTVKYIWDLQKSYPDRVFIVLGNHERQLIKYCESESNYSWLRQGGKKTLKSFDRAGICLFETARWMKNLPLFWENDDVFISHAGIAERSENPFDLDRADSILWNRQTLKNLNKVQIVGHTPLKRDRPLFNPQSQSWYIDTGACFGGYLSGIKLTSRGDSIATYSIKTRSRDISIFF